MTSRVVFSKMFGNASYVFSLTMPVLFNTSAVCYKPLL